MARQLHAIMGEFADILTGAGIPTALDIRELSAPGALLDIESVRIESLAADSVVTCRLALVAQDSGPTTALHQLSTLLDRFLMIGGEEFCSDGTDSELPQFTAAMVQTAAGRLPALSAPIHISASIGRDTP